MLLRISFLVSVLSILIGRAYQYIFWDAPLRAMIWDQSLMSKPVLFLTGQTWEEFAMNPSTNTIIRNYSVFVGIIIILAAISLCFVERGSRSKWPWVFVFLSSGLLFFHSFLDMKDKFYHIAQILETSIQVFTPLAYLYWKYNKIETRKSLKLILKLLVAITFAAHGLYAIGFYPVPGHFIDMTILSLGVSEDQARILLQVVGWIDLSLLVLLFIPATEKLALWYAIIWGLLTAFARIWSGIHFDFLTASLHANLYKTIYRLAHGLVPLTILLISYQNNSDEHTRN